MRLCWEGRETFSAWEIQVSGDGSTHRSKRFPTLRPLVAIHEPHPSIYRFHFASEVHIAHHSLLAAGALVVLGQL